MVRLTPPGNERLERATSLDLTVGGAELNSAATLACLDVPASWVSRLPDVPLGRAVARGAHAAGVDLTHLQWVPESAGRAGVYYLEEASDPRPSAVYYDRADSAFARMPPGEFDWPIILNGARALHISGITPALGPGPRAETMAAIRAANAASVPVAFDLNYRSKLWSETEARACFVEVVPLVDILFASRGMLRTFFNIEGDHAEVLNAARTRLGLAVTILSRKRGKASRSVLVRWPWVRTVRSSKDHGGTSKWWTGLAAVTRSPGASSPVTSPTTTTCPAPWGWPPRRRRSNTRCRAISSAPPAPRSKQQSSRMKVVCY